MKLDFRQLPDDYVATARDVADELDRIGHALKPLDVVVVNTAAGAKYGQPGYIDAGCGMDREATLYLLERGVRVVGTPSRSAARGSPRAAAPRSSGRAIRPAATSATADGEARQPRQASR